MPVHSGSVASSPSKNTSSIVYGFFRSFSTRASSSSIAALDPPSFAPTKRNCRNSFVSKWPVIRMRSASAPGILTTTLAIFDGAERRLGRERLERRREAERLQLIDDVGASLLVAGRAGGAGADGHELADVLEGARRIEPGRVCLRATAAAACRNSRGHEHRKRRARPAHADHPRAVIGT